MNISGVQPLSFLDYPGMPCSIVFTQGCPFRCSYCHNPDLLPFEKKNEKNADEILEYLRERKKFVDAVCVTGGEPTMQQGLLDFLANLKNIGYAVKLDTNGVRPDVVAEVIEKKLADYIAMDVKETWEKYSQIIRVAAPTTLASCKKTFSLIQHSGVNHEFRTTVMPGVHTKEDFFLIAELFMPGETYYIQETNFSKTLDHLEKDTVLALDVAQLVLDLRSAFPQLTIEKR